MGLLNLKTLSKSEGLAITLEQAKAHCFIVPEDDSQDEYLTDTILAAQSLIENDSAVPYVFFKNQVEAVFFTDLRRILLPKSPAKSVESVKEWTGEEWIDFDSSEYCTEFGDDFDFVILKSARRGLFRKLKITFTAGADSADEIRPDVKRAVASLVAYMFDNRAAMSSTQVYKSDIYSKVVGGLKRIRI